MQQAIHSLRNVAALLIMATLLFLGAGVPVRTAAAQAVGQMLFEKHCAGCHPDRTKMKLEAPLLETLRNPPRRMPAFDEDRLSDAEARAIGEYIRPGSQPPLAERKASDDQAKRPAKERKSRLRGFGTDDL